jgi:hypothetical protein
LFEFIKKCQQQEKEFGKEIRLFVDGLEKSKAWLEGQFEKLYSQLETIDPSLVQLAHTLAGAQLPYGYRESSFAGGKSSIEVLKRNWVIEAKPSLRSREPCKQFDAEDIPIPEFPSIGGNGFQLIHGHLHMKTRFARNSYIR